MTIPITVSVDPTDRRLADAPAPVKAIRNERLTNIRLTATTMTDKLTATPFRRGRARISAPTCGASSSTKTSVYDRRRRPSAPTSCRRIFEYRRRRPRRRQVDLLASAERRLRRSTAASGAISFERAESCRKARSQPSVSMSRNDSGCHRKPALRDGGSRTCPCRAGPKTPAGTAPGPGMRGAGETAISPPDARSESAMPMTVSLRGDDGSIIAENTIKGNISASAWTTYQASADRS